MKDIWDKFSDLLGKTIFHPQYFLKSYEHQAILVAQKYAKGILVDIGCGRQPYKKDLLPLVNKYIGVDHPNVSKFYKNKSRPDILADATSIPLRNNYCNTVLMISVLEHLPYPDRAIKEANRILYKGGYL
ncbi:MAG: class I SAM-dependent methyltransferase, partial [Patescibacteria group bacterium]